MLLLALDRVLDRKAHESPRRDGSRKRSASPQVTLCWAASLLDADRACVPDFNLSFRKTLRRVRVSRATLSDVALVRPPPPPSDARCFRGPRSATRPGCRRGPCALRGTQRHATRG